MADLLRSVKQSLFGVDPAALAAAVRAQRRSIASSVRRLDRQRQEAEGEERRLAARLREQALAGAVDKIQAKELVLLRRRRAAMLRCRAQLAAADMQVQQLHATQELQTHFKACAKLLSRVNGAIDLPQMQTTIKGFTRESHKLSLMDDIINDVLEDGTMQLDEAEDCEEDLIAELTHEAHAQALLKLTPLPGGDAPKQRAAAVPQQQQQQRQQQLGQQQQLRHQQQQLGQQQQQQQQRGPALHSVASKSLRPPLPQLPHSEVSMAAEIDRRIAYLHK